VFGDASPSLRRHAGPGVPATRSVRWSGWRWPSRSTPFRRGFALWRSSLSTRPCAPPSAGLPATCRPSTPATAYANGQRSVRERAGARALRRPGRNVGSSVGGQQSFTIAFEIAARTELPCSWVPSMEPPSASSSETRRDKGGGRRKNPGCDPAHLAPQASFARRSARPPDRATAGSLGRLRAGVSSIRNVQPRRLRLLVRFGSSDVAGRGAPYDGGYASSSTWSPPRHAAHKRRWSSRQRLLVGDRRWVAPGVVRLEGRCEAGAWTARQLGPRRALRAGATRPKTSLIALWDGGTVRRLWLISPDRRVRRAGRQHVQRVDNQGHRALVP
jgi:hypothetical protein